MARAAITTLVTGGAIGMVRFLLDVAHNALKWDLGGLNQMVEFSFLNFAVITFAFCVVLMIWISRMDRQPRHEPSGELTLNWAAHGWKLKGQYGEVAITVTIGAAILYLWTHFA